MTKSLDAGQFHHPNVAKRRQIYVQRRREIKPFIFGLTYWLNGPLCVPNDDRLQKAAAIQRIEGAPAQNPISGGILRRRHHVSWKARGTMHPLQSAKKIKSTVEDHFHA
jgi:hypothetical protein